MIRVNEDYVIEVDGRNYSAKRDMHNKIKLSNPENGTSREIDHYKTIGYYRDLAGAIKAIIEDMNKRNLVKGTHTLEEAINIIRKNNNQFEKLLKNCLSTN